MNDTTTGGLNLGERVNEPIRYERSIRQYDTREIYQELMRREQLVEINCSEQADTHFWDNHPDYVESVHRSLAKRLGMWMMQELVSFQATPMADDYGYSPTIVVARAYVLKPLKP